MAIALRIVDAIPYDKTVRYVKTRVVGSDVVDSPDPFVEEDAEFE
jgi:hypothetical protein